MNVETVDYQDPGARVALQRSLRDTGFAVLANHPITAERITTIYDGWGVIQGSKLAPLFWTIWARFTPDRMLRMQLIQTAFVLRL